MEQLTLTTIYAKLLGKDEWTEVFVVETGKMFGFSAAGLLGFEVGGIFIAVSVSRARGVGCMTLLSLEARDEGGVAIMLLRRCFLRKTPDFGACT